MTREQILARLRALLESMPEELNQTENASRIRENAWTYFNKSLEKLQDLDLRVGEYDYVAYNQTEEQKQSLSRELSELKINLIKIETYRDELREEVEVLEDTLGRTSEKIERYDELISQYTELSTTNLSEEEKERISKNINKRQRERESLVEACKDFEKRIEENNNFIKELESSIEAKNNQITEYDRRIDEINKKITEIKNKDVTEEEKTKLELNTEALYRMSKFVSANPRQQLSDIYNDFANGTISANQVEEKVRDLKILLTSGIYNIDDLKAKLSMDQIQSYRNELNKQIKSLSARIEDEDYYINNSRNEEVLERIDAYQELIAEIKQELNEVQINDLKNTEEIEKTEAIIAKYSKWIDQNNSVIQKIESSDMEEEQKKEKIAEFVLKNESFAAQIEFYNLKLENLKSKRLDYDKDRYVAIRRIEKYTEKINNYKKELLKEERESDRAKLEQLEAELLATYYSKSVFENDYSKEMDKFLVALNGGQKLEEDRPSFTKNFTEEQLEIYNGLFKGIEEEKEEIEKLVEKKEQEKERDNGKPNKSKLKRFKTISKQKVEKTKEYFKKNWKKVTRRALIIATCVGLIVASTCNSKKNTSGELDAIQNPAIVTEVVNVPYPAESIIIDAPEFNPPEVNIPQVEIDEPTMPGNNNNNNNNNNNSEDDTFVVTPETPGDSTGEREYILNTGTSIETGSTEYADSPYLHGESVFNPETNTFVDSEGNKITVNEDGTYSEEIGAETPIEVDENTSVLQEPDLSAVQAPIDPTVSNESVPTLEEAIEDGTLTPEEAQEFEDEFNNLFENLNGTVQGRGGR